MSKAENHEKTWNWLCTFPVMLKIKLKLVLLVHHSKTNTIEFSKYVILLFFWCHCYIFANSLHSMFENVKLWILLCLYAFKKDITLYNISFTHCKLINKTINSLTDKNKNDVSDKITSTFTESSFPFENSIPFKQRHKISFCLHRLFLVYDTENPLWSWNKRNWLFWTCV